MSRARRFVFALSILLSWCFLTNTQRGFVAFDQDPSQPLPDFVKYAGLPPEKAAEAMTVPDGFSVKLFAGEPDVRQPIAFCQDDRGRLWVAEAYSYPVRRPDSEAKDRILIFEDTDGDGVFDKRTVFIEGLNLVSGIEYGFGGIWIGAAPNFMFVPIKEGEDKPAGPPQILLDGWGYQDTHETLNTFTWGPDGWLYGCHGVFTHSQVGKPGTPKKERVPINAGVWRYHPTRHVFEVFAHGTSNPWGLDFDERGQAFITACVIPHNFHIIQGGLYHRQGGQHFNPYVYADIQTIAEHRHYIGAKPHDGNGRSDSAGGGHAHCGAMIYLGGAWPKEYHGQLFMGNIHGHRINVDKLTPKGSGFVATRAPDFLLANDAWARFINLQYGPDGNVFLIDWYDKQACHDGKVQTWDRTNGRIYKISHKDAKPVVGVDLTKKTTAELVELLLHPNEWYARHARRLLQERRGWPLPSTGSDEKQRSAARESTLKRLNEIALENPQDSKRLHALWSLASIDVKLIEDIAGLRSTGSPHVRGWALRLMMEAEGNPGSLAADVAKVDPSPVVRLYVASALQRTPVDQRWEALKLLLAEVKDASDHNLPLMYWYAAEPLAGKDPGKALDLAFAAKIPTLPRFMARRVSSAGTPEAIALVVDRLANVKGDTLQLSILQGLQEGLKGRRNVVMPANWSQVFTTLAASKSAEVRNTATSVAVIFGDAKAVAALRAVVVWPKGKLTDRKEALASLLEARDKQLVPVLYQLLDEPTMRGQALRGLALYDDGDTPKAILAIYSILNAVEKRDALNTLASRPAYGKALLDAVAEKNILANELSADLIRQLRNLNDKALAQRITEVWGTIRATPEDRLKQIAQWRKFLTAEVKADESLGRGVFAKACQQCHVLFGTGGTVGPDITGGDRRNLNYLLENILDPSAVIPKEYTATVLQLKDGRIITGIIRNEGQGEASLTVQTANEILTIARVDIDTMNRTEVSMMPDDLLNTLSKDEVRALIAYLQSPRQVPFLATKESAKDLFNGKDLSGWDGDPKLWSVENGEIVGKSTGIKNDQFLISQLAAGDFKLSLKAKLVPNSGNSGVQFHSDVSPNGTIKGPQADMGASMWGTLYEHNGRGSLWNQRSNVQVKAGDWNEYVIECKGNAVRIWLNGQLCVDYVDDWLPRRGVFGFQLRGGAAMEVRFRDLRLEVLEEKK